MNESRMSNLVRRVADKSYRMSITRVDRVGVYNPIMFGSFADALVSYARRKEGIVAESVSFIDGSTVTSSDCDGRPRIIAIGSEKGYTRSVEIATEELVDAVKCAPGGPLADVVGKCMNDHWREKKLPPFMEEFEGRRIMGIGAGPKYFTSDEMDELRSLLMPPVTEHRNVVYID